MNRTLRILAGLAGLSLVAACVTISNGPEGNVLTTRPSLSVVYTNLEAGFIFPPHLDRLHRTVVSLYTPLGNDISVEYELTGGVVATVYVYPVPPSGRDSTFDRHYEDCKEAVFARREKAQLISEGPVHIQPNASPADGRRAVFTYTDRFAGERQLLHSELYLFQRGQEYIMYRISCPQKYEAEAKADIGLFVSDFSWPGR